MFYYVNSRTGEQTYSENQAWDWKKQGIIVEQWTLIYPAWTWVKTYL